MLGKIKHSILNYQSIWFRILTLGAFCQVLFMTRVFFEGKPKEPAFKKQDMTNDYMNVCNLPEYDYWHPSIMKFVEYSYDPLSKCDKTFIPYTELDNGEWKIVVKREGLECKARCVKRENDYAVQMGPWMAPGKTDCEFLEAVCWEGAMEVYGYIHTQIRPKKKMLTSNETAPNVFVLLFDSMSTGSAKRSLPKTISLLSKMYQSVEFPFVNKVGENSRPNGIALWFGKQIEDIDQTLFGGSVIAPDWTWKEYCQNPVDGNASIFNDFRKRGYATMSVDDWAQQMINYPDCKGFVETPTDHYMHTFYKTYEDYGANITREHLKGHLCREEHHAAFEYFQQFIDVYKDRPMFSWMWLNSLGHDEFNGLMRVDEQVVKLIEKNRDLIDNSFFILMGDHGFRMSKEIAETEIGAVESNHPYLSISIPKNLRSNPTILATMRENAKRLQTHYDTRATLLDIARFQPKESFSNRSLLEIPGEKGHSYLRRQPPTPRTCGTLPVPPNYCVCQVKKVPETDENLKQRFGQKVLDHIHEQLDEANFTSSCVRFELKKVVSLLHYGLTDHTSHRHTFDISVKATAPSYAQFKTVMMHDKRSNHFTFGKIVRLDRYGHTGDCIKNGQLESMCFCKNVILERKQNKIIERISSFARKL